MKKIQIDHDILAILCTLLIIFCGEIVFGSLFVMSWGFQSVPGLFSVLLWLAIKLFIVFMIVYFGPIFVFSGFWEKLRDRKTWIMFLLLSLVITFVFTCTYTMLPATQEDLEKISIQSLNLPMQSIINNRYDYKKMLSPSPLIKQKILVINNRTHQVDDLIIAFAKEAWAKKPEDVKTLIIIENSFVEYSSVLISEEKHPSRMSTANVSRCIMKITIIDTTIPAVIYERNITGRGPPGSQYGQSIRLSGECPSDDAIIFFHQLSIES